MCVCVCVCVCESRNNSSNQMMCKPYLNRQSSGSVGKYYNKIEDKKNQQRLGGGGGGAEGVGGRGRGEERHRQTDREARHICYIILTL